MSYYSNPMSFGLPQIDFMNSIAFPTVSNNQPNFTMANINNSQHMEIMRLNSEIERLNGMNAGKDNVFRQNEELLNICRTLIAEKKELQDKCDNQASIIQTMEADQKLIDEYAIAKTNEIAELENKLSQMKVKALVELENERLKEEITRLNSEVDRFSKSSTFWLNKVLVFLLQSSMKFKYGEELRRIKFTINDDYNKTGTVAGRVKDILKEYFDSKHK